MPPNFGGQTFQQTPQQSPRMNSQTGQSTPGSAGPPPSPGTLQREQERVNLLLKINNELLQEVQSLQNEGKGGLTGGQQQQQQQQGADGQAGTPPANKPASKEYLEYVFSAGPHFINRALN